MQPLLVVAGSIRAERRSFRVAEYVRDRLEELTSGVELVDPRDYLLPPYDGVTATPATQEFAARCLGAGAFVFVSPEWHAGIPGTLKNMLDYLGGAHFDRKPVGLVSVSSAMGGATALSQLRDILGVLGATLVGPFVPVRNIKVAFDEATGRLADPRLDEYLLGALRRVAAMRGALETLAQA
jgi:NAD(P)H-dependent FMN reductase